MATSDADWFGNLFNAWLFTFLSQIIGYVGLWMVLFGQPDFYWDTMTSFGLLPAATEAYFIYIN